MFSIPSIVQSSLKNEISDLPPSDTVLLTMRRCGAILDVGIGFCDEKEMYCGRMDVQSLLNGVGNVRFFSVPTVRLLHDISVFTGKNCDLMRICPVEFATNLMWTTDNQLRLVSHIRLGLEATDEEYVLNWNTDDSSHHHVHFPDEMLIDFIWNVLSLGLCTQESMEAFLRPSPRKRARPVYLLDHDSTKVLEAKGVHEKFDSDELKDTREFFQRGVAILKSLTMIGGVSGGVSDGMSGVSGVNGMNRSVLDLPVDPTFLDGISMDDFPLE